MTSVFMVYNDQCMLRTGFRDGFLPFEAGKNHAGTGHRGFAGPGMQFAQCYGA